MKREGCLRGMICLGLAALLAICFAVTCFAEEAAAAQGAPFVLDITPVVQVLISALAILLTKYAIPWLKSHTSAEKYKNAETLVNVAVYAAEQMYGAGNGDKKLKYAQEWLSERGVYVDVENTKSRIRGMIEAAVYQMHQTGEEILTAIPAEATEALEEDGVIDLEVTHWSLRQLKAFCKANGIDSAGCSTKEEYIAAIEAAGTPAPEGGDTESAEDNRA